MSKKSSGTLVYSTGFTPNSGGKVEQQQAANTPPPSDGFVRIRRETSGRNGKGVTTMTGFGLPEDELKKLAQKLKQHCGTGGTVKDWVIEIQGDQREKLKAELEKQGFKVKLAGG